MTDTVLYLIIIIHIRLPIEFVHQLKYQLKKGKAILNNNNNVNPTGMFRTM